MGLTFKKPAAPVGAPKRTPLQWAGEIRETIVTGKKLWALRQLPGGYDFDYRSQVDDDGIIRITALVKGVNLSMGSLVPDEDGYLGFVRAQPYPGLDADVQVLGGFAANQFESYWHGIEVCCVAHSKYEFSIYD